jgi:hypothetical protein
MRFRKLRIAWSVACGIACVLLIVLWVRSYYVTDRIVIVRSSVGTVRAYSAAGQLITIATTSAVQTKPPEIWPNGGGTRIIDPPLDFIIYPEFGFAAGRLTNASYFQLPHWFLVTVFAMLTTLPWLQSRFTLRTLLIVTTLVAVVLGLIVWSVR